MHRLDGLSDTTMDQPAPRREDPPVDGFPDAVVREIEPLTDAVQDVTAHQLFHGRRRVFLAQPGRALEERPLELTADDRRHRGQ